MVYDRQGKEIKSFSGRENHFVDFMTKTAGKERAQEPMLLGALGAPLRQTTGDPFLPA